MFLSRQGSIKILLPWLAACFIAVSAVGLEGEDPGPLQLSVTHAGPATYEPGQVVEITVTITASYDGSVTALGLLGSGPETWTFAGARGITGDLPAVSPPVGSKGRLEFAWINMPQFPYSFAYSLQVPTEAAGQAVIQGQVEYRTLAGGRQVTAPDVITIKHRNMGLPTVLLSLSGPELYIPGESVEVIISLDSDDAFSDTRIGLDGSLPEGWTYAGIREITGGLPEVAVAAGESSELILVWNSFPQVPYSCAITLYVPETACSEAHLQLRMSVGTPVSTAFYGATKLVVPSGAECEAPGGLLELILAWIISFLRGLFGVFG